MALGQDQGLAHLSVHFKTASQSLPGTPQAQGRTTRRSTPISLLTFGRFPLNRGSRALKINRKAVALTHSLSGPWFPHLYMRRRTSVTAVEELPLSLLHRCEGKERARSGVGREWKRGRYSPSADLSLLILALLPCILSRFLLLLPRLPDLYLYPFFLTHAYCSL